MRFIRSRYGLVIWCAIALLILIVPLWRLRAIRQTKSPFVAAHPSPLNSVVEDLPPADEFGLSAPLAQQAARRAPADMDAQLAVLDVAQFLVRNQSAKLSTPFNTYETPQQLARAQQSLAARAKGVWPTTDAYYARFDDLEKRFPDSNLVRAAHLQAAMAGPLSLDEGPYYSYIYKGNSLVPTRLLMLGSESWMSPAARERAIQTARVGAQNESDNAFWPWMEAILQFSLRRDELALRALETAGGKTRFDDYDLAVVSGRLDTLKQMRATGWEDDWNEYSALPALHFYKMRSAARAVLYQMKLARQRGDKQRAFRWGAASARASAVVARNEQTLLCQFVGQALCFITWNGATDVLHKLPKLANNASESERAAYVEARKQTGVKLFALLARQNGDEALAHQTVATFQSFGESENYPRQVLEATALPAHIWQLSQFYWLNSQLLRLSLIAALLWGATWLLTFKKAEKLVPVRRQILPWAMFCAGVTGVLLVFARGFMPEFDALAQDLLGTAPPAPMPEPNLRTFMASWPYFVAALWGITVVVGAIRSARTRTPGDKRSKRLSWKKVVGLLLLCGFFGAIVGISTASLTDFDPPSLRVQMSRITAVSCILVGGVLWALWSSDKARPTVISFVVALWAALAGLITREWAGGDRIFYGQILLVMAGISMFVALFFAVRNGLYPLAKLKNLAFQIAARTRIAAGVLALLCAVAYFGITLWTIPVEHQTRAMMQRQLQIGEVAWLREQMAVKN